MFAINGAALIPLTSILSFAIEEIALRVGETLGGLLHKVSFLPQLLLCAFLVFDGFAEVAKSAIVGTVTFYLLFTLGACKPSSPESIVVKLLTGPSILFWRH